MSSPKRLMQDADASDTERQVLGSGSQYEPSPELLDGIWSSIAASIGSAPGPDGLEADPRPLPNVGTAAGAVWSSLVGVKLLAGIGLVVGLAGLGRMALEEPAPMSAKTLHWDAAPPTQLAVRRSVSEAAAVAASPAAADPERPDRGASTAAAAPAPPPRHAADPIRTSSVGVRAPLAEQRGALISVTEAGLAPPSALPSAEESRLLLQSQRALREGDAPRALSLLRAAEQKFPSGVLSQEREVLMIEALKASNEVDAASQRSQRFANDFPSSPHLGRVRAATKPEEK